MTMLATAAGCCVALSALFEVQPYAFQDPQAMCFAADAGRDADIDLFVLDGQRLTLYENGIAANAKTVVLPPGTSAVDVADITGVGVSDIVAICGDRILKYDLSAPAIGEPEELFRLETIFTPGIHFPFLHVLVVKRAGTPLLGLPREEVFELRAADGRLVESYPIGIDAPHHVAYGRPFSCTSVSPPQTGPPDSLEFRISRVLAFKPSLPEDLLPVKTQGPAYHRVSLRQARDAGPLDPESWPWFPLKKGGQDYQRVSYALTGAGLGDTMLRVQSAKETAGQPKGNTGAGHRYPGVLLTTEEDLPDFNGDGFVDIALWKAQEVSPTVNALSKAAMGGTWPISISTHLYAPEKGRYNPAVTSRITVDTPLGWFLNTGAEAPVHLLALRDFNGDGMTDLGYANQSGQYTVWCSGPKGFTNTPQFEHTFGEEISEIVLRADLQGHGKTSIVLRGQTHFYLLKAM